MESFENSIDSVPPEKYSRSERNIERKRESFVQEIEEKAKTLGMSPEEYLAAYAKNEKNSRERVGKENTNAAKKLFELGSATSAEINNTLHDKTGLQIELEHQRELATQDPLTGLLNRRGFDGALSDLNSAIQKYNKHSQVGAERRRDRHSKEPQPYCLLTIDIDKFKFVNDTKGHEAGDILLQKIAQIFRENTRPHESTLGRIGGDEFSISLAMDIDAACKVAERIRQAIEQAFLIAEENTSLVTASIGVAPYVPNIQSHERNADMAVYAAKGEWSSIDTATDLDGPIDVQMDKAAKGRNRVCIFNNNTLSEYQAEKH
ncbi:MAG: GGDEF domain-containing protein [Candidatus Moraniibacteriota bacterium]|nr:MAG: GGDEF domain-containing protein [Candidatus Moranbacteria bacterium]